AAPRSRRLPVFVDRPAFKALNAPRQEPGNLSESSEGQPLALAQVGMQQFVMRVPIGLPILSTALHPLLASCERARAALKREAGRLAQPGIPGRGSDVNWLGDLILL